MVAFTPNPSYSITLRLRLPNQAGTLAQVTQVIAELEGRLSTIALGKQDRI